MMDMKRRQPLGIELVKRGLITESDINKAMDYQREHPKKKIGDILNILGLCEPNTLIQAIGEILDEKAIYFSKEKLNVTVSDYISLDIAKQNKAIPFEVSGGKVKVCFADTSNRRSIDTIRLLLLNKGLVMEKYITFESNIDKILSSLEGIVVDTINTSSDIIMLVDSIIKTAMKKRASDIHIEPLENEVRIRYRIDGKLFDVGTVQIDKKDNVIGRLKAISNMHQEKQEAQDGRITIYPDYNIRVSSQKNVNGEKFVLRLLKKNASIKSIFELGFPEEEELLEKAFNKRNSMVVIAAPTGEGKTTTLYSVIDYLNRPEINITTIEDPVEIRIQGLNQIEIDAKTTFAGSLRTVLRQDPDIVLVGEIRDTETAEIGMQAGQTGHYVLSTIHTIDSIEVLTRLRKMGISTYDISSTLATSVSQRLVRKLCPKCAREREFSQREIDIMIKIGEKYNTKFNFEGKKTFDAVGCGFCNNVGYYDRIGIFEVLIINDILREAIIKELSTIEIKKIAVEQGYRPLVIDGIYKIIDGLINLDELNNKLILY